MVDEVENRGSGSFFADAENEPEPFFAALFEPGTLVAKDTFGAD